MLKCRLALMVMVFTLVLPGVVFGEEKENPLVALAKKEFKNLDPPLSSSEIKLLTDLNEGKAADFMDYNGERDDPNNAIKWGTSRELRAILIIWLCKNFEAQNLIKNKKLEIRGALIKGGLDLSSLSISFPLIFTGCTLPDYLSLTESKIKMLDLSGTHCKMIYAEKLQVEDSINFKDGFDGAGVVFLNKAVVNGDFCCSSGVFRYPWVSIRAEQIQILGDAIFNNGFKSNGTVMLQNARVKGNLNFGGSNFDCVNDVAIMASGLHVDGHVFFNAGFGCKGGVNLQEIRTGGNIDCDGGNFSCRKNTALNIRRGDICGDLSLSFGFKSEGSIDISEAKIGKDVVCLFGTFSSHCIKNACALSFSAIKTKVSGNFTFCPISTDGEVTLCSAKIDGDIDFGGGVFHANLNPDKRKAMTALNGDNICVGGCVSMRDVIVFGKTSFQNATIGRDFLGSGGKFQGSSSPIFDFQDGEIGGSLYMEKPFSADGEVRLLRTSIRKNIVCNGGQFRNKGKISLNVKNAVINGSVFFDDDFLSEGEINFQGAEIKKDLEFNGGKIQNSCSTAFQGSSIQVGGNVLFLNNFEADGSLDLTNAFVKEIFCINGISNPNKTFVYLEAANVGTFFDNDKCWPDKKLLVLGGFHYGRIANEAMYDANIRKKWLKLQPEFHPQPYVQLAKFFEQSGREEDAKEILIEKNWQTD